MVKKIAVVSLSRGVLGEDFMQHEIRIGTKRLNDMGIEVEFMPHALSGLEYVKNHPEDRAADLLAAFSDDSIDMILCAIGGDDTYRLLPYLFENDELKNAVKNKIFLGFSDTTFNHLMLHKAGLNTFYGQAFLPDVCEMEPEMLSYSYEFFRELVTEGKIKEIRPSKYWCEERTDWSEAAVGTFRTRHENEGFQLIQGKSTFEGEILGGCLDSIFDIFDNTRYSDTTALCEKYSLFPDKDDWRGKILLLETSEEQPAPDRYRKMLMKLKETGIFDVISGVLCGKPMDEKYFEEYKEIIKEVINNPELPVLANINIGHATPRCIIPFGVHAKVDADEQVIRFS